MQPIRTFERRTRSTVTSSIGHHLGLRIGAARFPWSMTTLTPSTAAASVALFALLVRNGEQQHAAIPQDFPTPPLTAIRNLVDAFLLPSPHPAASGPTNSRFFPLCGLLMWTVGCFYGGVCRKLMMRWTVSALSDSLIFFPAVIYCVCWITFGAMLVVMERKVRRRGACVDTA